MADNTTLDPGVGGDTIRDIDHAGVKTSVVGLDLNPAGAESLMAGSMPVTGTFFPATQPVSIAAAVTIQDGGNVISVDDGGGSITVDGPLTDAQLRAVAVPVSGTVSVTGSSVSVSNFPATYPVTDNGGSLTIDSTQLPAALGQTTMSASLPVVIASDQSSLSVTEQATAANLATLPALLKVGGAYDSDQKMVRPVPVATIGSATQVLVSDGRVRQRLKEMELILTDIRDALQNQRN